MGSENHSDIYRTRAITTILKKARTIETSFADEILHDILLDTGKKLSYSILEDQKDRVKWRFGNQLYGITYTVEAIILRNVESKSIIITLNLLGLWDIYKIGDNGLNAFVATFNQKTIEFQQKRAESIFLCSTCGKEVPINASFCPYDGTDLQKKCEKCGNIVRFNEKFCQACGTSLVQKSIEVENAIDSTIYVEKNRNLSLTAGIIVVLFSLIMFIFFITLVKDHGENTFPFVFIGITGFTLILSSLQVIKSLK